MNGRRFAIERLEDRLPLAGETFLVNFQLSGAQVPNGYLVDSGEEFGDRGLGHMFGWSSDHTDVARDRGVELDQRHDTLIHFHQFQNWEFQLPNGQYEVTVVVGDPSIASNHTLVVEGVTFWNDVPLAPSVFSTMTQQLTVNDGRLSLDTGNAPEKATRINYVHIQGVSTGTNQPPAVPVITEPAAGADELNPSDIHMEAAAFIDPDGDAHLSSDWEIWTEGVAAHRVWFTLGISGVERRHTHLGDGFFENSHAGRIDLLPNTNYELRVRFRDDRGAVSGDAASEFQTGSASTIFPLQLDDILDVVPVTWEGVSGAGVELPSPGSILSPGDPIIAIDLDGNSDYPGNESPQNALDGTLDKYLNFGEINSGFIVTPSSNPSIVESFQITTANDAEERDPTSWQLFGTNDPIVSANNSQGSGENWELIDTGSVNLPSARNTAGPIVPVSNTNEYISYRMVFTGVKNAASANSMQLAEIQFFGSQTGSPESPSLRVDSGTGETLLTIEGSDRIGNTIVNPPPLANHVDARIVVSGGSTGVGLEPSNLMFVDGQGIGREICLPIIDLVPEEVLYLWVAADGSTYYGSSTQMSAVFHALARDCQNTVPFVATEADYVVEVVAEGLQLPVNIAFIPNPGPNPGDPAFYVTELYGTIKAVTHDGTVRDYATGLLNFNPTGNFPGSGEQGLTGIVVDPSTGDVFASRVRDTDGQPGGAHHPQVVRFSSNDGGLTAASQTVILDMIGESQGQSHQISNLTMGPDNKLYVHNGDGFDFTTAQNLDSYRGKVLRVNLDGTAPTDNPFYDAGNGINARDYVFAYGFRNPFGGAWRASDGTHYEVENGPSVDRLARVDEGVNYGWNGSDGSMSINALYNWDPAHAPVNISFVQPETFAGSGFPAEKIGRAYVSESGPTYAQGPQSRGKRIVEFELDDQGNVVHGPTPLVEYVGTGRATVAGLAAGPDGLYFTDLYRDLNAQTPIDAGARVLRVRYVSPIPNGDFNYDGDWNCTDVDALIAGIASQSHDPAFDMTQDGLVDRTDLEAWLVAGGAENPDTTGGNPFLFGDANLDGFVDVSDFSIWNANKFTTIAAWCHADFNADGVVDVSDFSVWNAHKFTSSTGLAAPLGVGIAESTRLRRQWPSHLVAAANDDPSPVRLAALTPAMPHRGPVTFLSTWVSSLSTRRLEHQGDIVYLDLRRGHSFFEIVEMPRTGML